jgi:zinc transport system substrate-binding protein
MAKIDRAIALAMLVVAGMLAACSTGTVPEPNAAEGEGASGLNIIVSIPPQQYFVERIGGEYVDVWVMVPAGSSPATYEPTPEQLRAVSEADAYFTVGVPYEDTWRERIAAANRKMTVVDSARGIERQPMAVHNHEGEVDASEPDEEHAQNLDPHIWLSPRLVRIQAQTIYASLAELDAEHEAEYRTHLEVFLAEIDALDAYIEGKLAPVESRKFMVFHPSWGYFARDYHLEMIPIEVGGQEPSAAELAELITVANEEGVKVVFAQPEFSTRAAETIAEEIGGEVVLISPLTTDWLENLYRVADRFAEALDR